MASSGTGRRARTAMQAPQAEDVAVGRHRHKRGSGGAPATLRSQAAPSSGGATLGALQGTAGNGAVARLLRSRHQATPRGLQAKLMVGAANDPLEREADRVADLVMRTWSSRSASASTEELGDVPVRRLAEAEHDPLSTFEADSSVDQRLAARSGGGHALPAVVRNRMEAGFGADFSAVRVHRDAEAADLSTSLAARAFTHGTDIYFAAGAYDPGSRSGQHLLAHELTHVVQQDSGGKCLGRRRAVLRKVGFEFEDTTWHPWKVVRDSNDPKTAPMVVPAARKAKLHVGKGFRLEADDTPGPKLSNVEFVTEPFEESASGLRQLLTALQEMKQIVTRLAPAKGRPGPKGEGPPWPYDPWAYVTSGSHKLSGSSDAHAANIGLSGGSDGGRIKMQATMGMSLSELPLAMMAFGTVPQGRESEELARKRSKARELAGSPPYARILGHSPVLAAEVLLRLRRDDSLNDNERATLADTTKVKPLHGYLSLLMMYLKSLQVPDANEGAKSRIMFLARNKFSDLYDLLDPGIRALLAANRGRLLKTHLLDVSNAHPLMAKVQGQLPDTGLTLDSPLVNPVKRPAAGGMDASYNEAQQKISAFSIGHWLESVARGQDHLTKTAMALWLQNNTALSAVERTEASEWVFESFAEYDLDRSGAQALALFENRGILKNDLPFDQAAQVAFDYLLFFTRFKTQGVAASFESVDVSQALS